MNHYRVCLSVGVGVLVACGFAADGQAATPGPWGPTGQWTNIFDDEMNWNSNVVDTTKWLTQFWYKSTVGGAYMSAANITWAASKLTLAVTNVPGGSTAAGTWRQYTGSMINTYGKFRFTYGAFEVRAKMPAGGQGIDSAAFLINDSGPGHDVWPPEIDLMEVLSGSPQMDVMTYHWRENGVPTQKGGWFKQSSVDFSTDYHVFTLDWEPTFITWYIDGVARYTYSDSTRITSLPMYIVIDPSVCTNATGTSWCTKPTNMAMFPAHMDIDYVRVWQH